MRTNPFSQGLLERGGQIDAARLRGLQDVSADGRIRGLLGTIGSKRRGRASMTVIAANLPSLPMRINDAHRFPTPP
jgi:hypothetical protein